LEKFGRKIKMLSNHNLFRRKIATAISCAAYLLNSRRQCLFKLTEEQKIIHKKVMDSKTLQLSKSQLQIYKKIIGAYIHV